MEKNGGRHILYQMFRALRFIFQFSGNKSEIKCLSALVGGKFAFQILYFILL